MGAPLCSGSGSADTPRGLLCPVWHCQPSSSPPKPPKLPSWGRLEKPAPASSLQHGRPSELLEQRDGSLPSRAARWAAPRPVFAHERHRLIRLPRHAWHRAGQVRLHVPDGRPSECLACHRASGASAVQGFSMPGLVAGTAAMAAEDGAKRREDSFRKLTAHHHGVGAASHMSWVRGERRGPRTAVHRKYSRSGDGRTQTGISKRWWPWMMGGERPPSLGAAEQGRRVLALTHTHPLAL